MHPPTSMNMEDKGRVTRDRPLRLVGERLNKLGN